MINIFCFGNPYIKEDNLALSLSKKVKLKGFNFISLNNPEQLLDYSNERIIILDVCKGIKKIQLIKDIDRLEQNKIVSMHDFDLGFFLKLMKSSGKIKTVEIIALPYGSDENKIMPDLIKFLENFK
jgi:Ni,Fe-hydrogenase maturation factor